MFVQVSVPPASATEESTAPMVADIAKGIRQPNQPADEKKEIIPGKHVALLISVNEYNQINGLSPLRYCDNDMDGLATELEKFGYEIVRMSAKVDDTARHVNRTNVKEQLRQILGELTGENDVLLIAYSGHGVQEGDSRYLCPPNTPKNYDLGDLIPLYVSAENHAERPFGILNIVEDRFLDNSFQGTCFLFIDACRDGSETNSTATIYPQKGRFHIFSSCGPGEVSYEEDRFQRGRFMHFVIQAFNVSDGTDLDYERLRGQVRRQMASETSRGVQTPARHDTSYERAGTLILGRRKAEEFSVGSLLTAHRLTPRDSSSPESDERRYTVHRPIPQPSASRGVTQSGQWPDFSRKDQDTRNIITDIVQLPGLNGEWWFQETPWYIPHARLALAYIFSDYTIGDDRPWRSSNDFFGKNTYAYLDTNTYEARELLWRYLNSDECKSILPAGVMETIMELQRGGTGAAHSRTVQYQTLKDIFERLKKSRGNEVNPIDLYTFAVLEHQIALLSDRITRAADRERAKNSYQHALDSLKTEINDHPTALLFYQLCLADYSRLIADEGDVVAYANVINELTSSLKQSHKNSLFQISVFTEIARNESRFGRLSEAGRNFRETESRIAESRIAQTGHPLIAHYNEQCGWFRVDHWRLPQAKSNFETALLIRQYNAWSSQNPIDRMYVTYGLHAMGTIARFEGDNEKARRYFEEARESIERIRSNISREGISLMQRRLNDREVSTLERLADITLYEDTLYDDARNTIDRKREIDNALHHYKRGVNTAKESGNNEMLIRLAAKRALLLLQKECPGDNRKFEEARSELKEAADAVAQLLGNPSSNTVIPLLFFNAAQIAVDLCESVETNNETQFADARRRMRDFLERFHLFSRDPDGLKRDTMELRMHCAAMLLDAGRAQGQNDLTNADTVYLALCLYILSEKEGIHAYLRPHYERQLRLRTQQTPSQESIRSLAMSVQRMRNVSALSSADSSADRTIADTLSQTRGNTVAETESIAEDIESEEPESQTVEHKIFAPTNHPLIDSVTLVIFYFPADSEQNGLALMIPSGGRQMEQISLNINRKTLHIQSQTGELQNTLQDVWERIEAESQKSSPFFSDVNSRMRQSVVISWSDESCWAKDSRERITVDMFPYKDLPVNVTVQ